MMTTEQVAMQEDLWAMTLAELSPTAIERGMKRSAHRFPTYPPRDSEFLLLCEPQPEDIGHPRLEEALTAARRGRWRSHPAIWHTGSRIGTWDFRVMPAAQQERVFTDAYSALTREVAEAQEKDPAYRLEFPKLLAPPQTKDAKGVPTTKARALIAIGEIRQILKHPRRKAAQP